MKPRTCSECGERVRQPKKAGRPRFTCSRRCTALRSARVKREKREEERREMEEREYMADFMRWARGLQPYT
jgi:Ni/Co efflux regulator RcnB